MPGRSFTLYWQSRFWPWGYLSFANTSDSVLHQVSYALLIKSSADRQTVVALARQTPDRRGLTADLVPVPSSSASSIEASFVVPP